MHHARSAERADRDRSTMKCFPARWLRNRPEESESFMNAHRKASDIPPRVETTRDITIGKGNIYRAI